MVNKDAVLRTFCDQITPKQRHGPIHRCCFPCPTLPKQAMGKPLDTNLTRDRRATALWEGGWVKNPVTLTSQGTEPAWDSNQTYVCGINIGSTEQPRIPSQKQCEPREHAVLSQHGPSFQTLGCEVSTLSCNTALHTCGVLHKLSGQTGVGHSHDGWGGCAVQPVPSAMSFSVTCLLVKVSSRGAGRGKWGWQGGGLGFVGESGMAVTLLSIAADGPWRARLCGLKRSQSQTINFAGCSAPNLMWEQWHRARGLRIPKWYPSVVRGGPRHCARRVASGMH